MRGSTPIDHENLVDDIVAAFKKGKQGVNFRNASPYVVSGYRGKKSIIATINIPPMKAKKR